MFVIKITAHMFYETFLDLIVVCDDLSSEIPHLSQGAPKSPTEICWATQGLRK